MSQMETYIESLQGSVGHTLQSNDMIDTVRKTNF
jgi:hypothetical protein